MDGTVFLFFSNFHYDLPFLPEREKIVCNVHNKENYVVHIGALKQALSHRLILKKVHKVIQLYQKT